MTTEHKDYCIPHTLLMYLFEVKNNRKQFAEIVKSGFFEDIPYIYQDILVVNNKKDIAKRYRVYCRFAMAKKLEEKNIVLKNSEYQKFLTTQSEDFKKEILDKLHCAKATYNISNKERVKATQKKKKAIEL